MTRFGDFSGEKSTVKNAKRCTEVVIPRRHQEISDEAWDKTVEKAANMTIIQENSKSLVNVREPVINKGLLQYLQQLSLKNQELLSNTQKTIDLFQQKLKIQEEESRKQKELELKEKELKEKELKEKEIKEKEIKEQAHREKEIKEKKEQETREKQVALKTEKVQVSLENKQSKQNDLHSISGRVVSVSAYEDAQSCLQVITNAKKLKHALNSPSIFKGKMTIRTRCGQFMNLQSKVIEIAKTISSLLEEGKKESEQVYDYLMYLVAKQVVKQAETEVAVKKDLAFPIAVFCCMLMEKHLVFKNYLIGKMITKCPYIVPMYVKKGQSTDAEYRKNLGYIKKEDGSYETEIQYEERMCGVLSLYSAIVQTTALPHSYGIQYGWKWLSRMLNLPVRRISASLILTFIEMAGYEMYKKYPTQMPKLMTLLMREIIPRMPEASVASITRLQLFLEESVIKTGSIPEPFGKYLKKK